MWWRLKIAHCRENECGWWMDKAVSSQQGCNYVPIAKVDFYLSFLIWGVILCGVVKCNAGMEI